MAEASAPRPKGIRITEELVAHVGRLARLGISPAEMASLEGHFEKVLEFVKVLDGLDLSHVDPSIFPLATTNVFREDELRESLPVAEALRNAPAQRDGQFLVPRIVADRSAAAAEEAEESA